MFNPSEKSFEELGTGQRHQHLSHPRSINTSVHWGDDSSDSWLSARISACQMLPCHRHILSSIPSHIQSFPPPPLREPTPCRQRIRELPRPVFALSPDGTLAAAICMKRLEHASRGWGYTVSKAARKAARAQKHPLNDGLWVTNVATGKAHLAVSLRQLHEVTTKGT